MRRYLLPEGKQYKVNLHCHSTRSDGVLSPEELKARYRAMGYDAVAFTDHEILLSHDALCDDTFVALHGYEAALKEGGPDERTGDGMHVYHFCFIAKRQDNRLSVGFHPDYVTQGAAPTQIPFAEYNGRFFTREYSVECANRLISEANACGFLVTYNHPRWSLQNYDDYAGLEGLFGVEVFNSGTRRHGDCNAVVYEDILRTGKRLMPIAADDNHGKEEMFGGFEMVAAKTLSYDALTDALTNGDAYASEAPLFQSLYVEDGKVHVTSTPVVTMTMHTDTRAGKLLSEPDGGVFSRGEFTVPKDVAYVRFELADEKGRKAWSRAYDVKELA